MSQLEPNQIVYANLTLLLKEATAKKPAEFITLKGVVYKESADGKYKPTFPNPTLDRLKVKEPLKVVSIEVIVSLGYANTTNDYTEVNKSDEKRNNITGAYE